MTNKSSKLWKYSRCDPLSEGEKNNAFHNALMVSVTEIQKNEFYSKTINGADLAEQQLKHSCQRMMK